MFDVKWERPLHQAPGTVRPAIAPGRVVVHERGTRLVCLDAVDGSVRWDVPIGTWPRAIVIAGARCLVLPQLPRELVCLDLDTGRREWTVELDGFVGHLVVAGGVVLAGGWRGYRPVRLYDVESGRLLATADVHTVRPAVVDGGFLTGTPGGTEVRLLDGRDLSAVAAWTLPEPLADPDHRRAFTPVGGRFLVRCGRRGFAEVGRPEVVAHADHDLTSDAPHVVGGRVWLRERLGYTTVADGRVGWRFAEVGQTLVGRVQPAGEGFLVPGGAGTLFHLDRDGQVRERVQVGRRISAVREHGPDGLLVLTKGTLLALGSRLG
ncbi:outer membrane protein assembly factor BamB family protein [Saccharothrix variisporea]|uniref:Outer membrane protein assembly factor BamB n=1 Tax=Saccharothrix variisporea TaxID=543527 RepID=A0A495X600_9PSEU|nr:PQQ-binding-like beta-propeller repeat protein [Saccharothrix variisporea]RKT69791.1 outer membrane protein assembly factor BamB [Saccharothrix variisporea]